MPAKKIAAHLQISSRTVYRVLQHYKKFGKIIDSKPIGSPKIIPKKNCKARIKGYWDKYQCGSVKLHKIMKQDGYGLSQYKIQQIMYEFNFTAPCPKRRGQRKYCSYR